MILFNLLISQIKPVKTVEWLAQGHTDSQKQNSDENWGCMTPYPTLWKAVLAKKT